MNDLEVVLQAMAMAMVQAMEKARMSGQSVEVSFIVEGSSGRIAPIVTPNYNAWTGAMTPDGGYVGEFRP